MSFKTIAALAVAVAVAAPSMAFADTQIHGRSDTRIENALKSQGIAVSSVESWGEYVRAYVKNADGKTVMQFFDADSLAPVAISGN